MRDVADLHVRVGHPVVADLRPHLFAHVALDARAVALVVEVAHPSAGRQDLERIGKAESGRLLDLRDQSAVHLAVDDQVEMDLAIEVVAISVGVEPLDSNDAGVEAKARPGP